MRRSQANRPLRFNRLWSGTLGTSGTKGIYERSYDGRQQKLKLLILARKQVNYQREDGYLVPGWNRSVEGAMATYPMRMQRRLAEEVARIAASGRRSP